MSLAKDPASKAAVRLCWMGVALALGAVDLGCAGVPEARIVESYKPTMIGSVGIGVRKGDTELLAKINTSLAKLKANGTVEKILDKWGLKAQGT